MNALVQLGYWFMPEEYVMALAILLVAGGLSLRVIGLRRFGGALLVTAVVLVMLPVLVLPAMEQILERVPMWLVVALLVAVGFYFLRLVLAVFFGKQGGETILAMMVAWTLRKLLSFPGVLAWVTHGVAGFIHGVGRGSRALGIAIAIIIGLLAGSADTGNHGDEMAPSWHEPLNTEVSARILQFGMNSQRVVARQATNRSLA